MVPLADRIRTRRLALGLTQETLAHRLAVRQNVISRLESGGVKNPSLAMLRGLATTLGVTADYLVGLYDDAPTETSTLPTVRSSEAPQKSPAWGGAR